MAAAQDEWFGCGDRELARLHRRLTRALKAPRISARDVRSIIEAWARAELKRRPF